MIHISLSSLVIPQEWIDEAEQLTDQLTNTPEDDQARFIERNSHIWRRLKARLEEISHRKCWYCEIKIRRSDFHVDHHRPKNRIKNADGSTIRGYWWLAFDYMNFRLACPYCNCLHTCSDGITRGKSDYFPLHPNSIRAVTPNHNINDEEPLLLDPVNPADPNLLWFLDDGQICPKDSNTSSFDNKRATVTIDILNLNDIKIVEQRKRLWITCNDLVKRGTKAISEYDDANADSLSEIEKVYQDIKDLIKPSAELSATARTCFLGCSIEWVREIVT